MIIKIPDWCVIGSFVEWNAPHYTGAKWVKERIVAYGQDGFFHQAKNCPMYYTKFDEFLKTVRPLK